MHPTDRFVFFSFFSFLMTQAALAQAPAISPTDRAALEGSSFTHLPVGRASARMQTLHVDVPGGTTIHGHAYRRDAAGVRGHIDGFSSDLQVTLSMSPNLPHQASTTFANNAGSVAVVVLPRSLVAFPATDRPSIDPAATFELQIPYQVPFVVPAQGGTLCVDVEVWGNQSVAGPNRNLSIYLDSHENYASGIAEQPGFRFGTGCGAPGNSATSYATLVWWNRTTQTTIDVALRDGIAEDGMGLTRGWLALGVASNTGLWPTRPDCMLWGSNDVWFALPGTMNAQGNYDGSLTGLPVLPAGYRLWCQAGSVNLGTGALAFSDGTTLVTPPAGPLPIPVSRIVNSNDRAAATGAISYAVPVMSFN